MSWTLKDVADHWDNSPNYDVQNAKIDSYMRRFRDSAPLFTISEHAHVLDIDCRTGNGTVFFSKKYPTARFTCVAMAQTFKERAEKNLKANAVDATVSVMTTLRQPFADASFDCILCYETLEHVPWPQAFITELSRMLKPLGTLVLTTPNVLWEPVHWLSARLKLDHGEGPHRMVPRREILGAIEAAGLDVSVERTCVLVPAGPKWFLVIGSWLEKMLPEQMLRCIALRRTFVCRKKMFDPYWEKLKAEVIDPGLETGDGTCVGVSEGTLQYEELLSGELIVRRTDTSKPVPQAAYEGCPARYCNYPALNKFVFSKTPENFLSGIVQKAYIGYATDEAIRRNGASGGVISQTLIHLLETGEITGAVCLQMGRDVPWRARPVIARSREEILACAQSVYSLTPVNTILAKLERETGPLAYVGLPDQVAGIRKLQMMGHPSVRNIRYVLGPYTGTQMTFAAIKSFLRSHGVTTETEITELKFRAGQWPGHLEITLKDGRVLKAEKFHYNYLIPFFITNGSLQLADFTNELTDISVGDAWSPNYENKGGGYSVLLGRNPRSVELLESMARKKILTLEEITIDDALDMHGHMLDFKKRGSSIRNGWKQIPPDYGYRPESIPASRIAIEWILRFFFGIGRLSIARLVIEHLPISIVGPLFNALRKTWKYLSKPTKRRGLREIKFIMKG